MWKWDDTEHAGGCPDTAGPTAPTGTCAHALMVSVGDAFHSGAAEWLDCAIERPACRRYSVVVVVLVVEVVVVGRGQGSSSLSSLLS